MNPHSPFVVRLGLGVAVLCAYSVAQAPTLEKKIVEYGWDVPTAEYVRGHIREMEQRPFDGVIFRLEGKANVLEPAAFEESAYAKDFDNLSTINRPFAANVAVRKPIHRTQGGFDIAPYFAIEYWCLVRGGSLPERLRLDARQFRGSSIRSGSTGQRRSTFRWRILTH